MGMISNFNCLFRSNQFLNLINVSLTHFVPFNRRHVTLHLLVTFYWWLSMRLSNQYNVSCDSLLLFKKKVDITFSWYTDRWLTCESLQSLQAHLWLAAQILCQVLWNVWLVLQGNCSQLIALWHFSTLYNYDYYSIIIVTWNIKFELNNWKQTHSNKNRRVFDQMSFNHSLTSRVSFVTGRCPVW